MLELKIDLFIFFFVNIMQRFQDGSLCTGYE